MLESRTQIAVRYAETDMMGIVYHGNYLPWFEVGRTTLLKECGLPYKDLEAQGYHLPVIELGVKYVRPGSLRRHAYDHHPAPRAYRPWPSISTTKFAVATSCS